MQLMQMAESPLIPGTATAMEPLKRVNYPKVPYARGFKIGYKEYSRG